MKKFSVPCFFNGVKSPFTIYLGSPETTHHPLHFQADWLSKERGGNIPQEIMESIAKLKDLADKNNVSFEELCVYALGAASQENETSEQEEAQFDEQQFEEQTQYEEETEPEAPVYDEQNGQDFEVQVGTEEAVEDINAPDFGEIVSDLGIQNEEISAQVEGQTDQNDEQLFETEEPESLGETSESSDENDTENFGSSAIPADQTQAQPEEQPKPKPAESKKPETFNPFNI